MATLEQFLRTGELGPIALGMTPQAVAEQLGPPADVSLKKNPQICKYGALELSFSGRSDEKDRHLALIAVYFRRSGEHLPAAIQFSDWLPDGNTTRGDFERFVDRANLPITARVDGEQGQYLILQSTARVTFDGGTLHSIQIAGGGSRARGKQVSVAVPAGIWETVQQEAKKSNRSVSDLCAEWISERASHSAPN